MGEQPTAALIERVAGEAVRLSAELLSLAQTRQDSLAAQHLAAWAHSLCAPWKLIVSRMAAGEADMSVAADENLAHAAAHARHACERAMYVARSSLNATATTGGEPKVQQLLESARNREALQSVGQDLSHAVDLLSAALASGASGSSQALDGQLQMAVITLEAQDESLRSHLPEVLAQLSSQMQRLGEEVRVGGATPQLLEQLSLKVLSDMEGNRGGGDTLLRVVREAGRLQPPEVAAVQEMVRDRLSQRVPMLHASLLSLSNSRVIGEGGSCEVRAGMYDGQEVAVKLFRPLSQSAVQQLERELHREAYLTATVARGSPYIVQLLGPVLDLQAEPPLIALVFRLYECSLADLLMSEERMSALSHVERLDIAQQLARGVRHIHESRASLVHADLKPSNVLLDRSREGRWLCAVGDFGSASFKTLTSTTCRTFSPDSNTLTLRYAAPEVHSSPELPRRPPCDVWSLGLILAYMFTGETPFRNVTDVHLPHYLQKPRTVPDLSNVASEPLRRLIAACCSRLECERPSAGVVARELQQMFEQACLQPVLLQQVAQQPLPSAQQLPVQQLQQLCLQHPQQPYLQQLQQAPQQPLAQGGLQVAQGSQAPAAPSAAVPLILPAVPFHLSPSCVVAPPRSGSGSGSSTATFTSASSSAGVTGIGAVDAALYPSIYPQEPSRLSAAPSSASSGARSTDIALNERYSAPAGKGQPPAQLPSPLMLELSEPGPPSYAQQPSVPATPSSSGTTPTGTGPRGPLPSPASSSTGTGTGTHSAFMHSHPSLNSQIGSFRSHSSQVHSSFHPVSSQQHSLSNRTSLVPAPIVHLPPNATLLHLAEALTFACEVSDFDLQGQTLRGPVPAGGLRVLDGHTLRNGTLEMPPDSGLVIHTPSGSPVTLQCVTIRGSETLAPVPPHPTSAPGPAPPASGLVHVSSGLASLVSCTISDAGGPGRCGLLVSGGAKAQLTQGCEVAGSRQGDGVRVTDCGSKAQLVECAVHSNVGCNVVVASAASIEVDRSWVSDCGVNGVVVTGAMSVAVLRQCEVHSSGQCNVVAEGGGSADLQGSRVYESRAGVGLWVTGRGSKLAAREVEVWGSCTSDVLIREGATAKLTDCSLHDSRSGSGLAVVDNGSRAVVAGGHIWRAKGSNVVVGSGAVVSLSNCKLTLSQEGWGLEVLQGGSASEAECSYQDNAKGPRWDDPAAVRPIMAALRPRTEMQLSRVGGQPWGQGQGQGQGQQVQGWLQGQHTQQQQQQQQQPPMPQDLATGSSGLFTPLRRQTPTTTNSTMRPAVRAGSTASSSASSAGSLGAGPSCPPPAAPGPSSMHFSGRALLPGPAAFPAPVPGPVSGRVSAAGAAASRQLPVVRLMPGSCLMSLVEALASAPCPTEFDLGGQTLVGDLPGHLRITAGGHVIRDGILLLPHHRQLLVSTPSGTHTTLQNLTIKPASMALGAPPPPSSTSPGLPPKLHGLVQVSLGRAFLRACNLAEASSPGCAALMVCEGGSVELEQGTALWGSRQGDGLVVSGRGSRVRAVGARICSNAWCNVRVEEGGEAELSGCQLSYAATQHGLLVSGGCARVVAKGSEVFCNPLSNVAVTAGGRLHLASCKVHSSTQGPGVWVSQAGSEALLTQCEVHSSAESDVAVDGGAAATLQGCKVKGARAAGVVVSGPGSRLTLEGTAVRRPRGSGVLVMEGAEARLSECALGDSAEGWGMEVRPGARATVSGCTFRGNARGDRCEPPGSVASAGTGAQASGPAQAAAPATRPTHPGHPASPFQAPAAAAPLSRAALAQAVPPQNPDLAPAPAVAASSRSNSSGSGSSSLFSKLLKKLPK